VEVAAGALLARLGALATPYRQHQAKAITAVLVLDLDLAALVPVLVEALGLLAAHPLQRLAE
jgi:hypothetical protein